MDNEPNEVKVKTPFIEVVQAPPNHRHSFSTTMDNEPNEVKVKPPFIEVVQAPPNVDTTDWLLDQAETDECTYPMDDHDKELQKPVQKERQMWTNKFEYFLSCLGVAVGLGNVWRFPYLCYRNGGGAFLIPYFIMLTVVGIPLLFLELSLGQFTSNGPLTCWSYAPIFKGIGLGRLIVCMLNAVNYNMIIAWSIYYLVVSFTTHLPWTDCGNPWNTANCSSKEDMLKSCLGEDNVKYANGTCYNSTGEYLGIYNESAFEFMTGVKRIFPAEEYYSKHFLQVSNGIDEMGNPLWYLVLCLLLAWILVFLTMVKGVKSVGKVAYFTTLFPYVILTILLIRGAMLPNSADGIYFYMVPQWHRLADIRVWYDAALQVFFSLAVGGGGMITLSSYNQFHNNTQWDTLRISLLNCLTSIFAGFVVFSFLGYMAAAINTPIESVANSGAGFAFIVYPAAVSTMPISPLWAVMFFAMLITLGMGGQTGYIVNVLTSFLDLWPAKLSHRRIPVLAVICVVGFLLGIPLCTRGGVYIVQLLDTYAGGWTVFLVALLQIISLTWVYGYSRFANDIQCMIGTAPYFYWKIVFNIAPFVIIALILFSWANFDLARYGDYVYPMWANGLGWFLCLISSMSMPGYAIYALMREKGTLRERLRLTTTPNKFWGPALIEHRQLVSLYVKNFTIDPGNHSSDDQKLQLEMERV